MRAFTQLVLAIATSAILTTTAFASPAMVFRFDANIPSEIAHVPDHFSTAITRELGGAHASFSIDDAAESAGCSVATSDCLELVATNHHANELLFGVVSSNNGAMKVTLTRYVRGKDRQRRSFTLQGDLLQMTDTLVEGTRAWFEDLRVDEHLDEIESSWSGRDTISTGSTGSTGSTSSTGSTGSTSSTGSTGSTSSASSTVLTGSTGSTSSTGVTGSKSEPIERAPGRVSTPTIAILVGGSGLLAAGTGFLYSAAQIAAEVRQYRPRTVADFDRLVMLESQGNTRQTIGGVLAGVGLVSIAYGVVRARRERRAGEVTPQTAQLAPVPIEGGAALVYTRTLP
jgi:hypothetical protein